MLTFKKVIMRLIIILLTLCVQLSIAQQKEVLKARGLISSVEVVRDQHGVNHIYAQNEHDLFFSQGYCAARDRLFQFEIWRRQATGTLAEILGERELPRDIGARLFKFRGNLEQEFNHYHPRGSKIIHAFTEGVNAWINYSNTHPESLPLEFGLLGIKPALWTPAVVISRHQGLLNNLTEEISIARAVSAIGADAVKRLYNFEPGIPNLNLDPLVTPELLASDLIAPYEAFRKPLVFKPEDLARNSNPDLEEFSRMVANDNRDWHELMQRERNSIGSNNWIVSGKRAAEGFPMLANDPHRALATPSLRYLVHLSAPGWNVIGGGEPVIPGISIGHNEYGAWGLTVFDIDSEDLYVYQLDPGNPERYRYRDTWEEMKIIQDTFQIKGRESVVVQHRFTRHGPVTYINKDKGIACAVRAGWLEIGNAPYLASLRIDQSVTMKEFRAACGYSYLPGENMIWADRKGNIGWQAVGFAPVRKNWSGLVPVPGDGRYEWSGILPVKKLPHVFNPASGFFSTANENNVPNGYRYRNAVGWTWAEKYRQQRIQEVLSQNKKFTLADLQELQFDYLSVPARMLVPLLKDLKSENPSTEQARQHLLGWNFKLEVNSIAAGIYVAWEKEIESAMRERLIPAVASTDIRAIPLNKVLDLLLKSQDLFNNADARNIFLMNQLEKAVTSLQRKLGTDQQNWQYGQPAYHHVTIRHILSNAADPETRKILDHGPLPRGGYGQTPGMTTSSDNQTAGASFRMAVDTKDWDATMFTNTPGQSGNPASPFYRNLFESWAKDKHLRVPFSRAGIQQIKASETLLLPE
jgi:penicillin amidase